MGSRTIGIVGLGLIGGSFAKSYKRFAPDWKILAYNRTHSTLEKAMAQGVVDGELNEDTIPECDLVLVNLYSEIAIKYISDNKDLFSKSCIVMDACGNKQDICEAGFAIARDSKNGFTFIGGHPMAGNEFSGYDNSTDDMFVGASMIFVPETENEDLINRCKELMAPLGFGGYKITDAQHHDKMIAYTSQLAHVVASCYIKGPGLDDSKGFTGGSFRDVSRVSFLNAGMWTELFTVNREYLIPEIDHMISELERYRDALANKNDDELYKLLEEGSKRKEDFNK